MYEMTLNSIKKRVFMKKVYVIFLSLLFVLPFQTYCSDEGIVNDKREGIIQEAEGDSYKALRDKNPDQLSELAHANQPDGQRAQDDAGDTKFFLNRTFDAFEARIIEWLLWIATS